MVKELKNFNHQRNIQYGLFPQNSAMGRGSNFISYIPRPLTFSDLLNSNFPLPSQISFSPKSKLRTTISRFTSSNFSSIIMVEVWKLNCWKARGKLFRLIFWIFLIRGASSNSWKRITIPKRQWGENWFRHYRSKGTQNKISRNLKSIQTGLSKRELAVLKERKMIY